MPRIQLPPVVESAPVTYVVFRIYPAKHGREVIALFPYVNWDRSGLFCTSYAHNGQHGGADYTGVIAATRAASPVEYQALKRELESAPYHYRLQVIQRRGRKAGYLG